MALTIPTVRNKLDTQLQTRMLILGLEDYEGRVANHSRAVSGLLSAGYVGTDYTQAIQAWQAALRSLTGVRRVVVPVDRDEFRFDSDEVSHGARLWANLLGLMCAHAWLEQRNREVRTLPSRERAIVAAPEDYEVVYSLFEAACERSIQNLSETHRKILNALYLLQQEDKYGSITKSYSQRRIAKRAGIPQSTISDNKTFLVKSAKLLSESPSGGLSLAEGADPSWWEKSDVLTGFPKPEQVRAWWSGDDTPPDPETAGRPGQLQLGTGKGDSKGANGDRPSSGHHLEASGHPEQEGEEYGGDRREESGDRQASGQERGLDKPENCYESGVTGVTGGFEDYEEKVDGEEDEVNHLEKKDGVLGPGWESESAGTILSKLGWSRNPRMADEGCGEEFTGANNSAYSSVAKEIRESVVSEDGYAATPLGLFKKWETYKSWGYPTPSEWPTDPSEMQECLKGLRPTLRERGILAEYWQKADLASRGETDTVEAFWIFLPTKNGQPSSEWVEECVWSRVAVLEGIEEDDSATEFDDLG